MNFRRSATSWTPWLVLVLMVAAGTWWTQQEARHRAKRAWPERRGPYPSDWFGMQRAFPSGVIDQAAYRAAVEQAVVERAAAEFTTQALAQWQLAGPVNIGGRVTALAVAPNGSTIYLGSAAGGVFRSLDGGAHWSPIFDIGAAYSIGALALDPFDPATLYVGTGEANGAVDTYDGAGVYRTTNGGTTWEYLGLAETRRIGRIRVDPGDPNRLWVAAAGGQFSTDAHRGLYRSTNRGASWQKVLFVSDSTGVCDVAVHPANPDTLFCATWTRIRRPTYRRAHGPECGIWRTLDGGDTWSRLSMGLPTPTDSVGRIGLAIAPSAPSTVYAQIVGGLPLGWYGFGFYRSNDLGTTWQRRDVNGFVGMFGGFGWYFGDVVVDPVDANLVYALGVELRCSIDGGVNWAARMGSGSLVTHVDMHALWIHPANPSRLHLGNDGGFYTSADAGLAWTKSLDLPITQFYAGTIDPSNPARLLGGTQDNNTLLGNGSLFWDDILDGDGFQCLVDPVDPNVVFAEYQFMSYGTGPQRSADGGQTFVPPAGFDDTDRYNWNAPFTMNPRDHQTLLAGSHRVYRSRDNGALYEPISGDLTTNPANAQIRYGTITALAISPADTAVYYAGTDDARVWRGDASGASWVEISAGLPKRWVTRVTPDPVDPDVVYVTLSGFQLDESAAHVYRSEDRGASWSPIGTGLPNVPVNDLLVDPENTQRLFLANDVGVYGSVDRGATWAPLGVGLPVQSVLDLSYHAPSRLLVAATHGRSQWKLDLSAVVAASGSQMSGLRLSAPRPNPARGAVALELSLEHSARVEVAVFDAMGRRIARLVDAELPAGVHAVRWSGATDQGGAAPPGRYWVRAVTPGATTTRAVTQLR